MKEMNTVLVVEDDKIIREILRESFEHDFFVVLEASFLKRMEDILQSHAVDAVILDLNLPDGDGLDFIAGLRERTDVPVIILSGEHDANRKVQSFERGADDFVCKPFNPFELNARLRSHIRRYKEMKTGQNNIKPQEKQIQKIGNWHMDYDRYQLFDAQGNSAYLTTREFRLLSALLNASGRVVSRQQLCELMRDANYIPTPRAIDVKITRIRKKIGDDATHPHLIKTLRGIGYICDEGADAAQEHGSYDRI